MTEEERNALSVRQLDEYRTAKRDAAMLECELRRLGEALSVVGEVLAHRPDAVSTDGDRKLSVGGNSVISHDELASLIDMVAKHQKAIRVRESLSHGLGLTD